MRTVDEPNLILPKFSRSLCFFYLISFLALTEINIVRWKQSMILHFSCNFFTSKHYRSWCWSRWENLDRGQYPFQPIKFVHLVVPSPCETEPYNRLISFPSVSARPFQVWITIYFIFLYISVKHTIKYNKINSMWIKI